MNRQNSQKTPAVFYGHDGKEGVIQEPTISARVRDLLLENFGPRDGGEMARLENFGEANG
jgi:hypothetical protein